jgi:hypothetical protein
MTELFAPDAETQKRLEEEHIKRVLSKSLVHRQSELDAENGKLRARIAELEAALKPFADKADKAEGPFEPPYPVDYSLWRAARAALGEKE